LYLPVRPTQLLPQNREMLAIGVWNWSLPALAARLPDGRPQVTRPAADACARIYNGAYRFLAAKAKHQANSLFVLDFSSRADQDCALTW